MKPEDLEQQVESVVNRIIDGKFERFAEKLIGDVKAEFNHQITMHGELIQNKLDLVVEGQQMLGERMDRLEGRMDGLENRLERVEVKVTVLEVKFDGLEKKVDGIAADLSAHRCDTEAHPVYRVRES